MALYMTLATAGFLFTWGIMSAWGWVQEKRKRAKIRQDIQ